MKFPLTRVYTLRFSLSPLRLLLQVAKLQIIDDYICHAVVRINRPFDWIWKIGETHMRLAHKITCLTRERKTSGIDQIEMC